MAIIENIRQLQKEYLFPFLYILCLELIFFSGFIFCGNSLFPFETLKSDPLFTGMPFAGVTNFEMGDIPVIVYPPYEHYNKMIHSGKLWFWDRNVLSGSPFMASYALPYFFYPPALLLHRIFDTNAAHCIFLFIHMMTAGMGMYALSRNFGTGKISALFSSVAWMFSGQAVTWFYYGHLAGVYAYAPFVMLFFRLSIEKESYKFAVLGGIFLALSVLSSIPQPNYYLILFLLLYFLFRMIGSGTMIKRILISYFIINTTGFCIASPQILSVMELSSLSQRIAFSFSELRDNYSAPFFSYLLRIFCPDIMGNPALGIHLFLRGRTFYHEICVYSGILTISFAVFAVLKLYRNREVIFFAAVSLVSLLFASCTFFFFPFFKIIPFLDRFPAGRIVFLFLFCVSLLSGFGFSLIEKKNFSRIIFVLLGASVAFSVFIFYICNYFNQNSNVFIPLLKYLLPMAHFPFGEGTNEEYVVEFLNKMMLFYNPLNIWLYFQGLISFISFLVLILNKRNNTGNIFTMIIILLLSSVDLLVFGLKFLPESKLLKLEKPGILNQFSEELKHPGSFRLLRLEQGRLPNALSVFGIKEAEGHRNLYPGIYAHLTEELESRYNGKNKLVFGNIVNINNYGSSLLDMLSIKYLLSCGELNDKKISLILSGDGICLYERKTACPPVYFTENYSVAEKARIPDLLLKSGFKPEKISYIEKEPVFSGLDNSACKDEIVILEKPDNPDVIKVEMKSRSRGILVFSDVYFPGWQVKVDNQKAELLCVNFILKGVAVKQGSHTIEFYYKPTYLLAGYLICVVSLIAIFLFFLTKSNSKKSL